MSRVSINFHSGWCPAVPIYCAYTHWSVTQSSHVLLQHQASQTYLSMLQCCCKWPEVCLLAAWGGVQALHCNTNDFTIPCLDAAEMCLQALQAKTGCTLSRGTGWCLQESVPAEGKVGGGGVAGKRLHDESKCALAFVMQALACHAPL